MNPNLNNVVFYILIVDDDKDDQFFLRKAINEVVPQAIVESLYDGSEALQYLDKCTSLPNLIFLDLNMSRISGKETMRIIRQNEALSKVPVIILTSTRSESEKQEIMKLGANEFYSKPHQTDGLKEIVMNVRDKWLA